MFFFFNDAWILSLARDRDSEFSRRVILFLSGRYFQPLESPPWASNKDLTKINRRQERIDLHCIQCQANSPYIIQYTCLLGCINFSIIETLKRRTKTANLASSDTIDGDNESGAVTFSPSEPENSSSEGPSLCERGDDFEAREVKDATTIQREEDQ